MGQFSWLDCITGEQVIDERRRKSYVLVPRQFGGGHIEEGCYEGYGRFGGHDVYDLVADWNREHADFDALSSTRWCEWYFGGEENARSFFDDFKSGTDDAVMRERYGGDYKRTLGIVIACHDEDNANLRFPIKITHDPDAVYEWCAPSKGDPNQGWPDEDDGEWEEEREYEDDEW